ncbi:hypothetical protein TNCV_2930201 [Trichonephila clavipes]|nr:hypothetical protein TNCV_2930201 [Trichonephila clavipes]
MVKVINSSHGFPNVTEDPTEYGGRCTLNELRFKDFRLTRCGCLESTGPAQVHPRHLIEVQKHVLRPKS